MNMQLSYSQCHVQVGINEVILVKNLESKVKSKYGPMRQQLQ